MRKSQWWKWAVPRTTSRASRFWRRCVAKLELGSANALLMHLTLIPYIPTAGEIKTKPTQHSVKELRSIGLQPEVLLCRCSVEVDEGARRKISLFTNVEERAVIPLMDADSIYQIPGHLKESGLDDYILERFGLAQPAADLSEWEDVVRREFSQRKGTVRVGMVGKYVDLVDAYKSLNEALDHAGLQTDTRVEIDYIDAEEIEAQGVDCYRIWMPSLSPAGLVIAAFKARSKRFGMRGSRAFPSSVFAWACTWRSLNTRAMFAISKRALYRDAVRHPASHYRFDHRMADRRW